MHQKKLDLNAHPDVRQAAGGFQLQLTRMVNALQEFMTSGAIVSEEEWLLMEESLAQAFEESGRAMLQTGLQFVQIVRRVIAGSSFEERRLKLRSFQTPPLPTSAFSTPTQDLTGRMARFTRSKQFDV
jgi:hypothetical protein